MADEPQKAEPIALTFRELHASAANSNPAARPPVTDAPAYHTHPDYLALLAAIRANPADDTIRLIAADWLDEHGHGERAELVRLSVEYQANPDRWRWRLGGEDWGRMCDLLEPVQRVIGGDPARFGGYWAFERGFFRTVCLPFTFWTAHAARILPESVGLAVRLTDRPVVEWSLANRFVGDRGTTVEFTSVQIARLRGEGGTAGEWVEVGAGVMDTAETLLRKTWPHVARWEVPEYTPHLADGLVGAWVAGDDGHLVADFVQADFTPLFPQHGPPPGG